MPEVSFRKNLTLEEVPLPEGGGYSHAILAPEYKAKLLEEYNAYKKKVLRERVIVWDRCSQDETFRRLVYEKCKRDCAYFIDMFCFTFDDRSSKGITPLILYQFQREKMVRPYEKMCQSADKERVTIAWAKSRGVGFTWVSLACRLWRFIFHDNWSILIGSENRDDIDDGGQGATQNTLFGKFRMLIRELPKWMQKDLLGPLFDKEEWNKRFHMKNPMKPQNVVDGKQLGGMWGRSRRYSEALGDEVAHAEEMADADTSVKQTTNRFGAGSTPKGKGNLFHQMMTGSLKVVRIYMWWGEHPELDLAWYNEQRQHMTDDQIAQELDISFDRSAGDRVLHEVTLKEWFLDTADFDEHLPVTVLLDPGFADHYAAIWVQWDPLHSQGRVIDFVQTNRKTADWIVPFCLGAIPAKTYLGLDWPHEYNDMEKEIIQRHAEWLSKCGGIGTLEFLGDDAGNAKNIVTGSSAWDELERYGIYVTGIKVKNDEEAIRHTNIMLRHIRFASRLLHQRNGPKEQAPTWAEVVTQWRYPKQREGSVARVTRPIHDIYCHGGDCLKMWCLDLDVPDARIMPTESGRVVRAQPSAIVEPSHEDAAGGWRSE